MDSKFYNLSKKYHDFDIYKMTNEERYQFVWEVMLDRSCSTNTNMTRIDLTNGEKDADNEFLILPNNTKLSAKERYDLLKERFCIGIIYTHIEKSERGFEIIPIPCEAYFGYDMDDFCKAGENVIDPIKPGLDNSIKKFLSDHFDTDIEPFSDTWYIRNIPIDRIDFKPRELKRTVVKKGLLFKHKKTIKETVYDIQIKGNDIVKIGCLRGTKHGVPFTRMIPKWNHDVHNHLNSSWQSFVKNNVYLPMILNMPEMNSYIVCAGWRYNLLDWDNRCTCIQPHLCKLTPLFLEEIALKNPN